MPAPAQSPSNPDAFKLEQFGGMLPAWDDSLIPPGQAASSLNGYLFSGALQGWRKPKLLYTMKSGSSKFAYRLPLTVQNIATATVYLLALPVNGDNVLLGEEVYTFRTVVSKAYDVLIGANVTAAVTNLFQAFTADNGKNTNVGTNYGIGTVANPEIDQTAPITKNVLATDIPRVQVVAPT